MKARKTQITTFRFTEATLARLDAAAARLGLTRSGFLHTLIDAGTTRVIDPGWACRTVHVEGRTVHTHGTAEALPGQGLRTELVAPQVFWDWLDRVEAP